MNKEKLIECERRRFEKWLNFRLPYNFLKIGVAIALVSVVVMFFRAFMMEGDTEWLKEITKKTLLIGMLMMSLSRDKEEDEMTIALRMQSYAIAFVVGVVYALVMPYVEYGVSNVVNEGGEAYKDLGDFQVLLFMLMIQLMFYHNLKRYR
jgi:predicted Na+-dependent transporter